MDKLVLIDGQSTLHRIYNGMSDNTDAAGNHTNAAFGFLYAVLQIVEKEQPQQIMFFWEKEAPTIPVSLQEQIHLVKKVLENAGVFLVESQQSLGACLEEIKQKTVNRIILVTSDFKLLRAVDEKLHVLLLPSNNSQDKSIIYDVEKIQNEFGIMPYQLTDVFAVSGEKQSGLTGACAIGFYTAITLIQKFETVSNLLASIDQVDKKWMREALTEAGELIASNVDLLQQKNTGIITDSASVALTREMTEKIEAAMDDMNSGKKENGTSGKKKMTLAYQLIPVKNEKDITYIFQKAAQQKKCAFRFVHFESGNGDFGASQSGQMFLQLEEKKDIFMLFLCFDDKQVYVMEADELIPAVYLMNALRTLLWEKGAEGICFQEKDHYGELVSDEMDQRMSAETLMNPLFDCEIAAYLLNPLVSDYTIQSISKDILLYETPSWGDLFGKADQVTVYQEQKQEWMQFVAKETVLLWKLHETLSKELERANMMKLFRELEMPLSYVLFDMEREGILVKPDELKAYGETLTVRIRELEQIIYQEAGEQFNINSPKQLGEILFEKMQIPGGKKTKTGYSTAAEVLEKLAPDYPFVKDILEYRGLAKLKSTYAEGLATFIREDHRIHTHFNQTITATGRLSSTEPNLQNIPMRMELGRQIRKVFVPAEGCVFMDADYSQIELRVLAHMSQDRQLIEAYQMDEDIHRITASKVFHTPFEEVTDLQRRNAKAVNFGIVYGISSFGLSQDLSISPKEAKVYIDEYFKTYPGIKSFLEKTVEDTRQNGYCTSMFGRRRPVPELKSGNHIQRAFGERVAMNSPIQGTAADIIKLAMLHVYDALKKEGLQSKLILQIHDELLIETRLDEVEKVKEIMQREMKQVCDMAVALEIDLHTGVDWYEAK